MSYNDQRFKVRMGEVVEINNGQNGATFYPTVSDDGVISWTNDRGLDNPAPVNIRGKDGVDGADGKDGANGKDGVNGKDGTSVTVFSVSTSTEDGGTNVVTFSDGKTLTVKNGSKGSDGAPGKDGADGAPGKDGAAGKDGTNGKDGADGYTPVKGTDYFTPADKQEIVNSVIAALPVYGGEVVEV